MLVKLQQYTERIPYEVKLFQISFKVILGKSIGFMITLLGIEVNLENITAILSMKELETIHTYSLLRRDLPP